MSPALPHVAENPLARTPHTKGKGNCSRSKLSSLPPLRGIFLKGVC